MRRYLISFEDGAMTFPPEQLPEVSRDTHRVVDEAKAAGVWIFGAGLESYDVSVVSPAGSVTDSQAPASTGRLGGFSIIEVPGHAEAIAWAGKFAVSCRCDQEVREIGYDPQS